MLITALARLAPGRYAAVGRVRVRRPDGEAEL
jgi:hypothetical protein